MIKKSVRSFDALYGGYVANFIRISAFMVMRFIKMKKLSIVCMVCVIMSGCYAIPEEETSGDSVVDTLPRIVSQQSFPHNLEFPTTTDDEDVVVYYGFTSSYNHNTLVPNWVAWDLTDVEAEGKYSFKPSFGWDPNLEGRQAAREDYSNSGWDKGHMAPRADMKWSEQSLVESYYLTNICPQNHDMNAYDWCSVEKLCRTMASQYGHIHIVCGPIFTTNEYGTIGEHGVSIPDYFFKAMLVPTGGSYESIAFVMHNSPDRHPLSEYVITVDSLESIVRRDLFYNLNDDIEQEVESAVNLDFWGLGNM